MQGTYDLVIFVNPHRALSFEQTEDGACFYLQ